MSFLNFKLSSVIFKLWLHVNTTESQMRFLLKWIIPFEDAQNIFLLLLGLMLSNWQKEIACTCRKSEVYWKPGQTVKVELFDGWIVDSVLIRESKGGEKTPILAYFRQFPGEVIKLEAAYRVL